MYSKLQDMCSFRDNKSVSVRVTEAVTCEIEKGGNAMIYDNYARCFQLFCLLSPS